MGGKGKRYHAYDIHVNPYNAADFIGEAHWATVLQLVAMLMQS